MSQMSSNINAMISGDLFDPEFDRRCTLNDGIIYLLIQYLPVLLYLSGLTVKIVTKF